MPAQDVAIQTWRTHSGGADGEAGSLLLADGALEIFTRVITGSAWVSLFRLQDFDRDAVTAWFVQEFDAAKADLQVIQRGPLIREPRVATMPWMTTGRPVTP